MGDHQERPNVANNVRQALFASGFENRVCVGGGGSPSGSCDFDATFYHQR